MLKVLQNHDPCLETVNDRTQTVANISYSLADNVITYYLHRLLFMYVPFLCALHKVLLQKANIQGYAPQKFAILLIIANPS